MKNTQAEPQIFAGAIMIPIILFVLVSFFVGISNAFTNYILPEGNILYNLFTMITNLGLMFTNNLQPRFTMVIAFTLTKEEKGWAAFAGLALFFCFMRRIKDWAALEGWTAETTTVDTLVKGGHIQRAALNFNALWSNSLGIYSYSMGVFPGIVTGLIAAGLHNRFVDTKLPVMFGFLVGTKFAIIMVALVSISLAIALYYVWSYVVGILQSITGSIRTGGLLRVFVSGTLDKILLSFSIYHLITFPIEYAKVGGTVVIDGVMYEGVKNTINGQAASASATGYITRNLTNGRLLFQLTGLPDTAFTMHRYAEPENKKEVASLLVLSASTLAMVDISEPVEYTFLFIVPTLYWLIYAPLCGLCYVVAEITNVSINGTALFFMIPNLFQSQKVRIMSTLWLLPVTFIVYYFVSRFATMEFNLKTPGRDNEGEIGLMSKKEYDEIRNSSKDEANVSSAPEDTLEVRIIEAFGGADNIKTTTCCAGRFRVMVKDGSLITPGTSWKSCLEAINVIRGKDSVQVIYGVHAINVTTKIRDYPHLD